MFPSLPSSAVVCLAFVISPICSGCRSERSDPERDLTLLPAPPANAGLHRTARPARSDCVEQLPQRVALTGTVQREVRLGPPGYGETPAQDRRDTILVLTPARPIPVCNDPEIDAGGPSVITAGHLRLLGKLDPHRYAPGATLTVYGGFGQTVFGWHYTPVVFHVDSVVSGRAKAHDGRRSTT